MSFVDYGLNIFSLGARRYPTEQVCCADYPLDCGGGGDGDGTSACTYSLEKSCYHVIVDYLIDLGICAENELWLVQRELEKYRRLKLTEEQVELLRCSDVERDDAGEGHTRLEDDRAYVAEYLNEKFGASWRNPNDSSRSSSSGIGSGSVTCPCSENELRRTTTTWTTRNVLLRRRIERLHEEMRRKQGCPRGNASQLCDASFRSTIIEKDSEIISLKNEKAVKETEVREREELLKKLEIKRAELEDKIDELESDLRISRAHAQDAILQRNEDVALFEKKVVELERELREARQIYRAESKRKQSLADELKATKRRIEGVEATKALQDNMTRQLKLERDELDKRNREQEDEIQKFLDMVDRLNKKYAESQQELASARQELEARDRKLSQSREQLEGMERDASQLVDELSESLRRATSTALTTTRTTMDCRIVDGSSEQHRRCREHRLILQQQVKRLSALSRARVIRQLAPVRHEACRELARLRRLVLGVADFRSFKADLRTMIDDLLRRLGRNEKLEHACLGVAGEASLALERLNRTIAEQGFQRHEFESLFLRALEDLESAVDGLSRSVSKTTEKIDETSPAKNEWGTLSEKILHRLKHSTEIVLRITTVLRNESESNASYKKELEDQLRQVIEANAELASDRDESNRQCRELQSEIERFKSMLEEGARARRVSAEDAQSRIESKSKENEQLRRQARAAEKELRSARSQIGALEASLGELRKCLKAKELELSEACRQVDELNAGQARANEMIEQLESSVRRVNLESFGASHARIRELVEEKRQLGRKLGSLESQLTGLVESNEELRRELKRLAEDNGSLERCVEAFKRENQRLGESFALREIVQPSLCSRCDELLDKVGRLRCATSEDRELDVEQDKLRRLEAKLAIRDEEIGAKDRRIEQLESSTAKEAKQDSRVESKNQVNKLCDPQNWIQSLNPRQLRELHDRICKAAPLCHSASEVELKLEQRSERAERDVCEEPRVQQQQQTGTRRTARKADANRSAKTSVGQRHQQQQQQRAPTSQSSLPSSRPSSVFVPEKEYSQQSLRSKRASHHSNNNNHNNHNKAK